MEETSSNTGIRASSIQREPFFVITRGKTQLVLRETTLNATRDLPSFAGDEASKWVHNAEDLFRRFKIPDEEWVPAASLLMEGRAETWYCLWEFTTDNQEWEKFKQDLLYRFQPLPQDSFSVLSLRQERNGFFVKKVEEDRQVKNKETREKDDIQEGRYESEKRPSDVKGEEYCLGKIEGWEVVNEESATLEPKTEVTNTSKNEAQSVLNAPVQETETLGFMIEVLEPKKSLQSWVARVDPVEIVRREQSRDQDRKTEARTILSWLHSFGFVRLKILKAKRLKTEKDGVFADMALCVSRGPTKIRPPPEPPDTGPHWRALAKPSTELSRRGRCETIFICGRDGHRKAGRVAGNHTLIFRRCTMQGDVATGRRLQQYLSVSREVHVQQVVEQRPQSGAVLDLMGQAQINHDSEGFGQKPTHHKLQSYDFGGIQFECTALADAQIFGAENSGPSVDSGRAEMAGLKLAKRPEKMGLAQGTLIAFQVMEKLVAVRVDNFLLKLHALMSPKGKTWLWLFMQWDPGGLCNFPALHLEDKVNV